MSRFKRIDIWQEVVTKLTVILIYAFLYSLALNLFWQPGNIYAGGLTGIAQIIATGLAKSHIEVPISVIYYLLNVPMFMLAWFKINRKFVIYTVICVTVASFAIHIVPSTELTTDPIICAIFWGNNQWLFFGAGIKIWTFNWWYGCAHSYNQTNHRSKHWRDFDCFEWSHCIGSRLFIWLALCFL